MCGILGSVSSHFSFNQTDLSIIKHRGPDDEGIFKHGNVMLGHQRLSILDLSTNGHQPMISEDENLVLVFNGEIYNHTEIRKELSTKYTFKSTSDTETVLYGFAEYGTNLFAKLNGIFALAIYNKQTGELVCARDQYGIKPLYYSFEQNSFVFSSEIKAILSEIHNKEISASALANYLSFLWCPGQKTPYEQVFKLDPGYYITINSNAPSKPQFVKYYDIPFGVSISEKTEVELIEQLNQLLITAVDRQLQSDVPVGFFLSGGLDSSAMVAIAKKLYPNKKWQCYTIDADSKEQEDEGFSSDLYYAKLVANHLDVKLSVVNVTPTIINEFDKMIWHLDEPQADPAPLNVLKICEQAKQDGYKVLLGGTAGDDLFSGYRRHQALKYEKYFALFKGVFATTVQKFVSSLPEKSAVVRRLKKLTKNLHQTKIERMFGYFEWLDYYTIFNLFSKDFQEKLKNHQPIHYFNDLLKNIPNEKSDLNKMLYWELKTFLPAHNLNYTDKLSMATGVEVRVPFLDVDLVNFSTTIPPELKMKGVETKYLLKKVMENYLPKEVIYRPKTGFGAPVRSWIKNDLKEIIQLRLSEDRMNEIGIFNPKTVKQLIADNDANKIDASYSILSLLAIESWVRQFAKK